MRSKLNTLILIFLTLSFATNAQECLPLNQNGNFESVQTFIGSEPANGISTNLVDNWEASHGTVDYFTPNWDWYGLDGLFSNAGHLCYGNRESHDHSEGMFTNATIVADDDLVYSLSFDLASVCDASESGYLNIALNNNLSADGHNWFQYPTEESLPHFFEDNQLIDKIELNESMKFSDGFMHHYELSFIPEGNFSQLWFFSEYQHPYTEFVNCGVTIDNVELKAMTTALEDVSENQLEDGSYIFEAVMNKELEINNYDWILNGVSTSDSSVLKTTLVTGTHNLCLDIVDSRGACGSVCITVDVEEDVDDTSIGVDENYEGCIYKVCLDSPGLPYLNSFTFVGPSGQEITLNENTFGFNFPYCAGGDETKCTEQGDELHLFLADLNLYFSQNDYKAKAQFDVYSFPLESFCKGRIISVLSNELAIEGVVMADYYSDDLNTFPLAFAFDPNLCDQSAPSAEGGSVQAEIASNGSTDFGSGKDNPDSLFTSEYDSGTEAVEVIFQGGNEILQGGIYTIDGKKLIDLQNFTGYDTVDCSAFTAGTYILRVTSRTENQTELFFKS